MSTNRAAVAAGLVLTGSAFLSGCSIGSTASPIPGALSSQEAVVGGYEGWWNSTPVSGDTTGLPDETVAVHTDTGEIVDVFNRAINDRREVTQLSDVPYTVVSDPEWPAQSIVIIDTRTDEIIETFPVNSSGRPTR
jgi:hypothetical protein